LLADVTRVRDVLPSASRSIVSPFAVATDSLGAFLVAVAVILLAYVLLPFVISVIARKRGHRTIDADSMSSTTALGGLLGGAGLIAIAERSWTVGEALLLVAAAVLASSLLKPRR
jgi:hypothetical protein